MRDAATARYEEDARVLLFPLELDRREWELGFPTLAGRRPRERTIGTGEVDRLEEEIH